MLKILLFSSQKSKWYKNYIWIPVDVWFLYRHKSLLLNDDEKPEFNRNNIQIQKLKVTEIWVAHGVFFIDFLPKNTSFNSLYFILYIESSSSKKVSPAFQKATKSSLFSKCGAIILCFHV